MGGIKMNELLKEIQELENTIAEYISKGFRVNEYLLAKLEILKAELTTTK